MRFDPLLKPFLLELNNKFTSYRLGNIIKLKSTYSIRIYELLKQYENITERTICLENLRYYLDAVHIYPNYANFKQRILHPVQKELNENTDITFDFQEIKLGKKVYKIKFIIYSKKKSKKSSNYSERDLSSFQISNEFEKRIKEFEHNINQQVPLKTLKEWEKYSNIVLNIFEDIKLRTDIKFPIAYIDNVLNAYLKNNKSD
ncbi:initiator RepB protein, partial [Bacillus cereus]